MSDVQDDILNVITLHNNTMRTGLKHGEQSGLGKVATECNRMMDACGLTGSWNQGYRKALCDVRAYILAELRSKELVSSLRLATHRSPTF